MRQLKSSRFSSVLTEYLKNRPTDFHQTYVIFWQLYMKVFEIKRLKIVPIWTGLIANLKRLGGILPPKCTFQILEGCQGRRTGVGVTTISYSLILGGG